MNANPNLQQVYEVFNQLLISCGVAYENAFHIVALFKAPMPLIQFPPDRQVYWMLVRLANDWHRSFEAGGDPLVDKLKDFLRISEAAEYLGVSPNTLRNWENAGKISAHRHPVNGYRLFKQEELDELLRPIQPSEVFEPDQDSGVRKQASIPKKKPR